MIDEEGGGTVYLGLSIRNVGAGIAVLQGWDPWPELARSDIDHHPVDQFRRQIRDIYIAPGDVGLWQGSLHEGDAVMADIVAAHAERRPFMIDLLYSDQVGGQRTVTVRRIPAAGDRLARQRRTALEPRSDRAAMSPAAGTLLSVNVGMPKDVAWQGRTVFTGVFKEPVDGPRRVRRLNIDGDGQGDLAGTAASSARSSSTSSTRTATGSASSAATTSSTGSSARTSRSTGWPTTRSASATATGSAARSSRSPSRGSPATASASAWTIRGCRRCWSRTTARASTSACSRRARSQAGDEIVKVAAGPEQMTVAEVDALLYLPGHPRQQLQRALRIPALSPGWQASFRALLEAEPGGGNAGLAPASPPPAWPGFRPLRVTDDRPRERLGDLDPPRGPRRRGRCPPRCPAST